MITLERYLDGIWRKAVKHLPRDHGPLLIAEQRGAPRAVLALPWQNTAQKHAMLKIASRALEESGAYRYALICEVWMVALPVEARKRTPDITPSLHPDRFTALQVTVVDRSPRRALFRAGKIVNEGTKRQVVDVRTVPDALNVLAELFPQTATAN